MEPKNEGLEDDFPFQTGDLRFHVNFQGCMFVYTSDEEFYVSMRNFDSKLGVPNLSPKKNPSKSSIKIPFLHLFFTDIFFNPKNHWTLV